MRAERAFFVFLAAMLFAAADGAAAQSCDRAPRAPRAVNPTEVDTLANDGFEAANAERSLTGQRQIEAQLRRRQFFRNASRLHWRWTCDRRQYFSQNLKERVIVLVRGVVFFDLGDDSENMRIWYDAARLGFVQMRQAGNGLKTLDLSVADLLRTAGVRLNGNVSGARSSWYYQSGRKPTS